MKPFFETKLGKAFNCDALDHMQNSISNESIDLILTSPPFGLVRKKDYGNVDASDYVEWFRSFAEHFSRILKPTGSLVIDIGGAWIPGQPTRSLYHYELLIMLCREFGFHLAQEFFWWNPSRLPTPAEWVTVRRIRVKDAVNCVWWLSKTPWPKASNKRVLVPYSDAMKTLLKSGYKAKKRPSGHDISEKFSINNGAAIPPNVLAIPNTESNSHYLRYCKEKGLVQHPARFPVYLPEFFIRMTTDRGDQVYDPFGGSCVTGEAAEKLGRHWEATEILSEYLEGAKGRFSRQQSGLFSNLPEEKGVSYKLHHPLSLLDTTNDENLRADGGKLASRGSANAASGLNDQKAKSFRHKKAAKPATKRGGRNVKPTSNEKSSVSKSKSRKGIGTKRRR